MVISYDPFERTFGPAMEIISLAFYSANPESCAMSETDVRMKSIMEPRFLRIESDDDQESAEAQGDYRQCIPELSRTVRCTIIENLNFHVSMPDRKVELNNHIKVKHISIYL